ncbi:hypothetical protein TorRG33x02_117650 [Trema orientale]|uniref:Uncharacterized protein n=1 Tax=Trema orientale TaxID=63057 RepID=A0A2P5F3T4_TREOI|nr:hypothetical protein TorRG33x02_117650 [Trema orientale]
MEHVQNYKINLHYYSFWLFFEWVTMMISPTKNSSEKASWYLFKGYIITLKILLQNDIIETKEIRRGRAVLLRTLAYEVGT